MAERITIQDIADALGLSRNTVSKAINNTGILADATREKVLKKAIEMGYKQFSYVNIPGIGIPGADPVCTLSLKKIICVEMFNPKYCSMLCELGTPLLFVDSPASGLGEPLKADVLSMDNQSNIHVFVHEMARRGKKRIGYIGNCMHCQSFFERFLGYRNAMYLCGLSCLEEYCITGPAGACEYPSQKEYRKYLRERIQSLDSLPDVFICANDFVAIDALLTFKELGICVPKDVWMCGFDDSQESRITSPTLTTIHIHSQIMGFSAVHLLLSRIKDPSMNYRRVYTETSLIYRESTED